MKTTYSYQVTVNFELSNEDFELVTEAMKSHSDTQRYTKSGEFWYGNMNRYKWRNETPKDYEDFPPFSATTHQLQLIVKSLEPYVNYTLPDKQKQENGIRLYYLLWNMLKSAIEHSNEIHQLQLK